MVTVSAKTTTLPVVVSVPLLLLLRLFLSHNVRSVYALSLSSSNTVAMTSDRPSPRSPLPPRIRSDVPGTWAHSTMSSRVDADILQRTYDENADVFESPGFADARRRFDELRAELRSAAPLRHLDDVDVSGNVGGDEDAWRELLRESVEQGETYLSAPWLLAEFYVYRRLVGATGWFDETNPATHRWDPFAAQKRAGLDASSASAGAVLARLPDLPTTGPEGVALAAAFSLWGNRMDLSLWPAETTKTTTSDHGNNDEGPREDAFASVLAAAADNLLHDDTDRLTALCERLRADGGGQVDVVVDNAGFELVTDLALADHLVASGVAKVVVFRLKSHPTFVSDAMEKDLRDTVDYFTNDEGRVGPVGVAAGNRWTSYLDAGAWVCREHDFWVRPAPMWDMPPGLRAELADESDLTIVKGDANYRRLLDDRTWDLSNDSFEDVVGAYFPCPVCALRTLKAELGCGMDADKVRRAREADPDGWSTSGRFGVVHFGSGA